MRATATSWLAVTSSEVRNISFAKTFIPSGITIGTGEHWGRSGGRHEGNRNGNRGHDRFFGTGIGSSDPNITSSFPQGSKEGDFLPGLQVTDGIGRTNTPLVVNLGVNNLRVSVICQGGHLSGGGLERGDYSAGMDVYPGNGGTG